jgi:hypothetical protein
MRNRHHGCIFLSYRRNDTSAIAGRLFDGLVAKFGKHRVFKDVDSIEGGEPIRHRIRDAIEKCSVFIALIGDDWIGIQGRNTPPRIMESGDYVAFEVATALQNNIRVIPVLVAEASFPRPDQIPPKLAQITDLNALRLRNDPDFNVDFLRLLKALPIRPPFLNRSRLAILFVVFAALCAIAYAIVQIPDKTKESHQTSTVERQIAKPLGTISNGQVGIYKVGTSIPVPDSSDNYTMRKATQIRQTEEGPTEDLSYILSSGGEELLVFVPEFDLQNDRYTDRIGEIKVVSSRFKTKKGIGVNSTLQEFVAAYPDYRIWTTYVSGMYVVESPSIRAQFLLRKTDYIGGEIKYESDITKLKLSDFKRDSKIYMVRVQE